MPTSIKFLGRPKHVFAIQQAKALRSASRQFNDQRRFLAPFVVLLLLYCGWVLSLPVFPTQDGPMHLYYVNVIHHLLSGNSLFNKFYSIRTPLPPYTIQYLFLLGLTKILQPALAEKCMVCLILISTAFGFRFFATSIGKDGKLMSLWIFPLALGWPLFMGFHNFCLSLSFTLWALGIWFRAMQTMRPLYCVFFALAVILVTLTHPVPLLFLLAVIALDTCVRLIRRKFKKNLSWGKTFKSFRWNLVLVSAAYCSLGYIALFLNKPGTNKEFVQNESRYMTLKQLVSLEWMCLASGGTSTKVYRLILYGLLLFCLFLTTSKFRSRSNSKMSSSSITMFLATLLLLVVVPILPSHMNGLDYFVERLPVLIWFTALAAAGSSGKLSSRCQSAIAVCAFLYAGFDLGMAEHLIRPVANDIVLMEKPPPVAYRAGLIFAAPRRIQPARVNFNPYFLWNAARYFQRAGILLLNDPWAGPPNILPINRYPSSILNRFSQSELMHPDVLYKRLISSETDRNALLANVDFIMFVGLPAGEGHVPDPLLALDSSRNWTCQQSRGYFACSATQQQFHGSTMLSSTGDQTGRKSDHTDTFKVFSEVTDTADH